MSAIRKVEPNRKQILIVEGIPLIRRGLRSLLAEQPDLNVYGDHCSADDLHAVVQRTPPHLLILGLSACRNESLDFVKHFQATHRHVKILILWTEADPNLAERLIRAGADGCVCVTEKCDEIVNAVRRVLDGEIYLSQRLSAGLVSRVVSAGNPDGRSRREILSDREYQVLERIGNGLSVSQIAEEMHISPKTVFAHRENLKKKLRLRSSVDLLQYAIKVQKHHKGVSKS